MPQQKTLYCNYDADKGVLPVTCSRCRDVPEGDINSTLTDWACSCSRCWTVHAAEGGQCEQRQLKRTVARLASLQHRLAMLFSRLTFLGIITDSAYLHRGIEGRPEYPTRVLLADHFSMPAAQGEPIPDTLTAAVVVQAACVENCILAIANLSAALAWLTSGMKVKLRELHVAPKPVEQVVIWYEGKEEPNVPATIHTVLVISPELDNKQVDSNKHWREEIGENGWVLDATFPQYGFQTAIQPVTEYLRTRVQTSNFNSVQGFGGCLREYQRELASSDIDTRRFALFQEIWMLAMNRAIHREIMLSGGRQAFLNSRHDHFCYYQRQIEDAVDEAVQQARASTDAIWCQHEDGEDVIDDLQELQCEGWNNGHAVMMAELESVRTG